MVTENELPNTNIVSLCGNTTFMFASKEIPQSAVDIIAMTVPSWICLFGQMRRNLLPTLKLK